MPSFSASTTTTAPPAKVWELLSNRSTWGSWSETGPFTRERDGKDGGDTLGAIGVFHGRRTPREEVVDYVPNQRFSYTLLSGLAIRGYRADVTLAEEANGGTRITWAASFRPKLPGTGWMYARVLQGVFERMVEGLATAAAAR